MSVNSNPLLGSIVYTVEFNDEKLRDYAEIIIAKNIYDHVDEKGRENLLIIEIIYHQSDSYAVQK